MNDMRVHATLILMEYEYIPVTYEYIRMMYGQYMDDVRVHTSGI